MKTIYKYGLPPTGAPVIYFPKGAKILTIQGQQDLPQIWAEVDPNEKETEPTQFMTFGTGHTIPDPPPGKYLEYVATWQINDGMLVFHTYKVMTVKGFDSTLLIDN